MPHAIRLSGQQIIGYDPSKAQPLPEGWQYVTWEQFTAAQGMEFPAYVIGQVVNAPPPPPTEDELAAQIAQNIQTLWQAATTYQEGYISGAAIGLLTIGVIQGKPKSTAIMMWVQQVWALYYSRKPTVTPEYADYDFRIVGPMPYSVPELQVEVLG